MAIGRKNNVKKAFFVFFSLLLAVCSLFVACDVLFLEMAKKEGDETFSARSYTVIFNLNDGSGSTVDKPAVAGGPVTEWPNDPDGSGGRIFIGWYSLSGNLGDPGERLSRRDGIRGDTEVYGRWYDPNPPLSNDLTHYIVTFNKNHSSPPGGTEA